VIRAKRLFESALITIERLDHPADVPHVDPELEVSPAYSINFIEAGRFSVMRRGRRWDVGATELFLTVPGQAQRFIHDECEGAPADVVIAVSFNEDLRDDIQAQLGKLPQNGPVVPITNRLAYLHHRLLEHVVADGESLTIDLAGIELLAASLEPNGTRRYRPSQLVWYARRVDAARERLDHHFEMEQPLSQLAREAGMSPFHFARVFRELTGMPPHRYLLQRRLAAATGRLRDGCSVTDTCFAVGFRSLSHFIHAFRRMFGVSPSRFATTIERRGR
jgi:AraC family transcriptional regulator